MLIKKFDSKFKKSLATTILELEKTSNIELVFLVKEVSGDYTYAHLIIASISAFIAFSLFIFLPFLFGDYLIYAGTILTFFIGLALSLLIDSLGKIFIKKEKMKRNVEIMARAYFQKGAIYDTRRNTGILIYCSLFEKKISVIADKGIKNFIPLEEFNLLETNLNKVFNQADLPKNIIENLNNSKSLFAKYIPPVEDDINELSDDMEITI